MRAGVGAMLGLVCVALGAATPTRAQDGACETPAYMLASDSVLGRVADAVRQGRPLEILVVGSRSSSLAGPDTSYPARLQASLRERLPGVTVSVAVDLKMKTTAEDVAGQLGGIVEQRKPTLLIWQTGTYDAIRSVDPEEFRTAVEEGVGAVQKAGADAILMNLQYSPRTETMMSASPYLDAMRVVAQQHDLPLFDRFAIMRHWSDSGEFDLFSSNPGMDVARKVHDCLGRSLAAFIIEAARINPAELRIQR